MRCENICPYAEITAFVGEMDYKGYCNHSYTHMYCNKKRKPLTSEDECLCGYNISDIIELNKKIRKSGRIFL